MSDLVARVQWFSNIRFWLLDGTVRDVTIATFGCPYKWARNSYVTDILHQATRHKPNNLTILVGLPSSTRGEFAAHVAGVHELARKWKVVKWRFAPGSHVKYVLATYRSVGSAGMVGSFNFSDSLLHDLGVSLSDTRELVAFHTRFMRGTLPLEKLPDPGSSLPNGWEKAIMELAESSEPAGDVPSDSNKEL